MLQPLTKLFASQTPTRPVRTTLGVESLDRRDLAAAGMAAVSVDYSTLTLRITGSSGDDTVAVMPSRVNPGWWEVRQQEAADERNIALHPGFFPGKIQLVPQGPVKIRFEGRDGNDAFVNRTHFTAAAFGGAGDDVLGCYTNVGFQADGGGGNDVIVGGNGDDLLSGGEGDDRVYGSGGNDDLYGVGGIDTLSGGSGNECLNASSWFNFSDNRVYSRLEQSPAMSLIVFNEYLYGGTGRDAFTQGGRNYTTVVAESNESVHGTANTSVVYLAPQLAAEEEEDEEEVSRSYLVLFPS